VASVWRQDPGREAFRILAFARPATRGHQERASSCMKEKMASIWQEILTARRKGGYVHII
jgi:hypothetical protein